MGTSIEMIERHHGPLLDGSGANMATRLAIFEAATLRIARSADVAQLVERRLPKPKVAGSSPVVRFGERPGNPGFPVSGAEPLRLRATVAGNRRTVVLDVADIRGRRGAAGRSEKVLTRCHTVR